MGTGVRPGLNVLFNERRHFWLKAACGELPQSTYANLETTHTHINPFLLRYTHNTMYEVKVVHMQQVKAYQSGILSCNTEHSDKDKNSREELTNSMLHGSMGRTY